MTSFELNLPEKKFSALGNKNLWRPTGTKTTKRKVKVKVHGKKKTETRKVKKTEATSLLMPTEFVASERRGDQTDHEDPCHGLPEGS